MLDFEKRYLSLKESDFRSIDGQDAPRALTGYAMVWDKASHQFGSGDWAFEEVISRDVEISKLPGEDIRSFWNHDDGLIIAREANGSLIVEKDDYGLRVTITPVDTQYARDMFTAIDAGLISGMSFIARFNKVAWVEESGKMDQRQIQGMDLISVDPVSIPMYPDTEIAVKSYRSWKESRSADTDEEEAAYDKDKEKKGKKKDKKEEADEPRSVEPPPDNPTANAWNKLRRAQAKIA